MNNHSYEIYKNIMSVNPVIDKNYLSHILNHPVESVEITDVAETNTALAIKARTPAKKLFIKTIKHDLRKNVYHRKSMKEGIFYKAVQGQKAKNLPIPMCYDAFVSQETEEFVIVLEDISDEYTAPSGAILADKNTWFSCAESLARFHAAFWNHGLITQGSENEENDDQEDRACLRSFLDDFNERFDDKTKTVLRNAMEINLTHIKTTARRLRGKQNVTLCNGDSHIHNFMLPVRQNGRPLIVDFQFWRAGIGTGDLAHLTRVNFSEQLRKDIQLPLVVRYYESLAQYGITGYAWEDCLRDYRICVWEAHAYSGSQLCYPPSESWVGGCNYRQPQSTGIQRL